jgi:type III secretory pathway component EscT
MTTDQYNRWRAACTAAEVVGVVIGCVIAIPFLPYMIARDVVTWMRGGKTNPS